MVKLRNRKKIERNGELNRERERERERESEREREIREREIRDLPT